MRLRVLCAFGIKSLILAISPLAGTPNRVVFPESKNAAYSSWGVMETVTTASCDWVTSRFWSERGSQPR
jgi:hypothetical protein